MIIENQRCKYCGKVYSYHRSGEYCHDKYNNDTFCPECFKIMLNALESHEKNIIKYVSKYREVKDNHIEYIRDLKPLKDDYLNIYDENNLLPHVMVTRFINFDLKDNHHLEGYYFNCKEYIVQVNDNDPSDYIIYLLSEYNTKDNKFTEKPWIIYDNNTNNRFFHVTSYNALCKQLYDNIKQKPMNKPLGKLWYADFDIPEWTVELNNNNNNNEK